VGIVDYVYCFFLIYRFIEIQSWLTELSTTTPQEHPDAEGTASLLEVSGKSVKCSHELDKGWMRAKEYL
tara:strand:+ start:308 stop:514 length:207 start_codon:yes stop_codon:yes gene_type:complete